MRQILLLISLIHILSLQAQFSEKPKLVVGIVVDQMRQDYMHRYWDKYSENGLKRMVKDGFEYKNAHYNYVPTYTGPGHASVYTGTTPSRHGIIGNSWYSRVSDETVYCAGDSTAIAAGGSGSNGSISALNMKTTTVTDELRMFSNDRSKVIGVAIKDRGSALPAGHHPTGAYWYDNRSGDFISSSYYMEELPEWVNTFNNLNLPQNYVRGSWEPLLEIGDYVESTPDENDYERSITSKETATLPYNLLESPYGFNTVISTPFGNTLTTDFALAAIEGEGLGADEITDFLAISYSSTDIAGHAFGPRAVEMQDMYLKFDQEIARLLGYLDEKVGAGAYTVFLTADHGVADVPGYYMDRQYPGGYFDADGSEQTIIRKIFETYGKGRFVLNVSNNQVYLNRELIRAKKTNLRDFQENVAEMILEFEFVEEVFISEDLKRRQVTDPFALRYQAGFNTRLSGDLVIVTKGGYLPGNYGTQGTSHGSGYSYDTQVPILFYGKSIPAGNSVRQVSITDIAPTVSMILDIPVPSASTGQPLVEIFE